MFKSPVVKFPPILIFVVAADESYTGDVIFVPMETDVPLSAVLDVKLPIVMVGAFVVAEHMLTCPLLLRLGLFPMSIFPPVCNAPIDNPDVVKFPPIDMAVVAEVESYVDDVIFVPTLTEVPFKAIVDWPVLPMTIGVMPVLLLPILIAPVVLTPAVG